MRDNVKEYARIAAQVFDFPEPVLEIGSRSAEGQEQYADIRPFFQGKTFLGCDFMGGTGVDIILDGHAMGVRDGALGSIVTLDTLEHVQDPFLVLRETHRVLREGALLLVAVPMMFAIHNHPWDYWRYTPAALDLLLRPFGGRAVFYQGDPVAPHAVFGIAVKSSATDATVTFDARVEELLARWEKDVPGGPLVQFEPLLEALAHDVDPDAEPEALSEITPGGSVVQEFVCELDHLRRIDLKFTREKPTSTLLTFRLEDTEKERVMAQGQIRGLHVLDKVWTPLMFPPIVTSARRRYRLTLESVDGAAGDAFKPLVGAGPPPSETSLQQNGESLNRGLCMRVLCRQTDYEPTDYRSMVGSPPAPSQVARLSPDAVREVAKTHSEQLWYVSSRMNERFDRLSTRVEALEMQLNDVLLFIRNLQSSKPVQVMRRVGRLLRRSGD